LGDFFGQGWAASYPFSSFLLAAGQTGGCALNSFFPMPFAVGARIEVENQSDQPVDRFYYHVDYRELPQLPNDLGRFHAWWNRALMPPRLDDRDGWGTPGSRLTNPTDRDNYLVLDAAGRGHFLGMNYYVDNPSPEWPGEGNDVFRVDGEPWPGSLPGTGTEDYFGCAWDPATPFQHPYLGYAFVDVRLGWLGRAHAYRFHVEGTIPFQRSLRVSFEHGHANVRALDLASVAYWYQAEPRRPFPPLPSKDARAPMPAISVEDVALWRAAWEQRMGGGRLWGNEGAGGGA
jgi:hypothetical protein